MRNSNVGRWVVLAMAICLVGTPVSYAETMDQVLNDHTPAQTAAPTEAASPAPTVRTALVTASTDAAWAAIMTRLTNIYNRLTNIMARLKQYNLKSNDDLFDPMTNIRVMIKMSNNCTNWQPWSAYKNGSYRKYENSYSPK